MACPVREPTPWLTLTWRRLQICTPAHSVSCQQRERTRASNGRQGLHTRAFALTACVLGRVPSQRCASESACRRCPNPVPQVIGATGQPIPARRVRVPVAIHEELKQAAMVFLEKWVNAGGGALECTSVGSGLYVQESLPATHSACSCSCAAPGVSELCAPTGTESS